MRRCDLRPANSPAAIGLIIGAAARNVDVMELKVECYAGYRGEEEPRAFTLGSRRLAIVEILDRWLSPKDRYFKVKAEDGGTYVLRHDPFSERWELTLFQA